GRRGGARGAAAGGGGSGGSAPGEGGGSATPAEAREALVRDLGLSADQQARLEAIFGEAGQAFTALRGQNLDDRARETQRRRIRGETREKIRAILTPEQRPKYEAIVAAQDGGAGTAAPETPARVYVVGADGKLKPLQIVV